MYFFEIIFSKSEQAFSHSAVPSDLDILSPEKSMRFVVAFFIYVCHQTLSEA
jgi:hypothetical protein